MSNYPDGFGSRFSDWYDPRSPLYEEPDEESVDDE